MYLFIISKIFMVREACAINLGSSVILTGRVHSPRTTVSQYNEAGWVRDLPPLQQGRYDHACSYYSNAEGTKVDIDIKYCSIIIFQTMLVTGGYDDIKLSSTELLVETASAWVFTGELPSPLYALRGANIDNRVFVTGN